MVGIAKKPAKKAAEKAAVVDTKLDEPEPVPVEAKSDEPTEPAAEEPKAANDG
jgi:hypothetical protein